MTEFTAIRPEHYALLKDFLTRSRLIDMGFASLYSLRDSFRPEFAFIDGCLVLRMYYGGETAYCHPLGELDSERLSRIVRETGAKLIDYIPTEAVHMYERLPGFSVRFEQQDKYSDYFSLASDFTDPGRTGHPRKYTDYRSFVTHFDCDVVPIDAGNIPDCKRLMDAWCGGRDCSLCAYGCERPLEDAIFDAWDELPVRGIIVYIGGEPQGYLMGEQNGGTALILYGKPVGRQNGLNVFMHIELIRRVFPTALYVNFSPDSGMPGLSLFKKKFTPYTKLDKFLARPEVI